MIPGADLTRLSILERCRQMPPDEQKQLHLFEINEAFRVLLTYQPDLGDFKHYMNGVILSAEMMYWIWKSR